MRHFPFLLAVLALAGCGLVAPDQSKRGECEWKVAHEHTLSRPRANSSQFLALSTRALAPIHGIIARSCAPVFSIGCAAAAFLAAFNSG